MSNNLCILIWHSNLCVRHSGSAGAPTALMQGAGNAISWVDGMEASGSPLFSLSIISPSFSPNPARREIWVYKTQQICPICNSIKMLNVEGILFTAVGRICPQHSSSASAKKKLKDVCEPSVSVCVVTHQQHDSRRGQMCPCYIIDDGGRKQSLFGGGWGWGSSVLFFSVFQPSNTASSFNLLPLFSTFIFKENMQIKICVTCI